MRLFAANAAGRAGVPDGESGSAHPLCDSASAQRDAVACMLTPGAAQSRAQPVRSERSVNHHHKAQGIAAGFLPF